MVLARKLVVNGTTIKIKAGAHDYDLLAEMGLFNREIIKEYDSMQDFLAEQDMKNDYDEYIPAIMQWRAMIMIRPDCLLPCSDI